MIPLNCLYNNSERDLPLGPGVHRYSSNAILQCTEALKQHFIKFFNSADCPFSLIGTVMVPTRKIQMCTEILTKLAEVLGNKIPASICANERWNTMLTEDF